MKLNRLSLEEDGQGNDLKNANKIITCQHLLVQNQQKKHQNHVRNLFQVNNISHTIWVFPLLNLNKYISVGIRIVRKLFS